MKILIIGGKGTIGKKVSDHFLKKHEIIIGGRNSGDIVVDIANSKFIQAMYESVGNVDAVVCLAGEAKWAAFDSMTEEDLYIGKRIQTDFTRRFTLGETADSQQYVLN